MEYVEVFNNLQRSINEKGLSLLFSKSIKDFKVYFGVDISTKFLRGLSDLNDTRKTTKRITYLMNKNKLKTKRATNIYKIRGVNSYIAVLTEWGHDEKNKPFPEAVGLTDDEKRQIEEMKSFSENTGIDLFNHAEANRNGREHTRKAFNYKGGAVVRDVKVVKVGSYAVMSRSEVLRIVIIK